MEASPVVARIPKRESDARMTVPMSGVRREPLTLAKTFGKTLSSGH